MDVYQEAVGYLESQQAQGTSLLLHPTVVTDFATSMREISIFL